MGHVINLTVLQSTFYCILYNVLYRAVLRDNARYFLTTPILLLKQKTRNQHSLENQNSMKLTIRLKSFLK